MQFTLWIFNDAQGALGIWSSFWFRNNPCRQWLGGIVEIRAYSSTPTVGVNALRRSTVSLFGFRNHHRCVHALVDVDTVMS